jgi:tetratricopeptide (TPR) repeat protein
VDLALTVAGIGLCLLGGVGGADPAPSRTALGAEVGAPARWEEQVSRNPYDYEAHRLLVNAYRRAGRYDRAFVEAAWLAWLAPKEYAESEQGLLYLRDRRARDRAANARAESGVAPATGEGVRRLGACATVVAAVDVRRSLYDCCADGAIAQQATRLRTEVEETLTELRKTPAGGVAGQGTSATGRDPVARMAMTDIYLALDDILVLEGASDSQRARTQALRAAASQAEAASAAVPEAPGPHRALAVIRGRLAELNGSPAGGRGIAAPDPAWMWNLAIAEGEQAYRLDPKDTALPEMLWALTLRAGRWEEAKRWETVATAGEGGIGAPDPALESR